MENEKELQVRSRKPLYITLGIIGAVLIFLAGVFITYAVHAEKFSCRYFDNTYINGINASGMTPDELRAVIRDTARNYSITVSARGRDDVIISAEDVNLSYKTDATIDNIQRSQNKWRWFLEKDNEKVYFVDTMLELDDALLEQVCSNMPAFDSSTAYPSENAYIGEYDSNISAYAIVSEVD